MIKTIVVAFLGTIVIAIALMVAFPPGSRADQYFWPICLIAFLGLCWIFRQPRGA